MAYCLLIQPYIWPSLLFVNNSLQDNSPSPPPFRCTYTHLQHVGESLTNYVAFMWVVIVQPWPTWWVARISGSHIRFLKVRFHENGSWQRRTRWVQGNKRELIFRTMFALVPSIWPLCYMFFLLGSITTLHSSFYLFFSLAHHTHTHTHTYMWRIFSSQ